MRSLAESQIIAPGGEMVARASTEDDELVLAVLDLDRCWDYKRTVFNFARYRLPDRYRMITDPQDRTGADASRLTPFPGVEVGRRGAGRAGRIGQAEPVTATPTSDADAGVGITRRLTLVFAAATGLAAANLYYAQPLLEQHRRRLPRLRGPHQPGGDRGPGRLRRRPGPGGAPGGPGAPPAAHRRDAAGPGRGPAGRGGGPLFGRAHRGAHPRGPGRGGGPDPRGPAPRGWPPTGPGGGWSAR